MGKRRDTARTANYRTPICCGFYVVPAVSATAVHIHEQLPANVQEQGQEKAILLFHIAKEGCGQPESVYNANSKYTLLYQMFLPTGFTQGKRSGPFYEGGVRLRTQPT